MSQNIDPKENQKAQNERQGQQNKPQGQFPNKDKPQQGNKRPDDERRPGGPNRPMTAQH
jgi:hypothetical protein